MSLPALALLVAGPALGQVVTADFEVPDGLEVKVWAESPQLRNPTNIDVDARGRIWVTEGVNYRIQIRKSTPGDGYLRHPKGDRVMVLEDTDGDGAADKSTVFVEDPELVSPLGIAVIGNKVVVSSSPAIFVYTDTDGDDRADTKEVFLTGFGGFDHDHGVHAFVFGPDGRWYFNTGNEGPLEVRDRAGFTLRMGKGHQKSDDGRLWLQGLALRVRPDGTGLEVLAHNFRNNYELAVDAFGNLWQNDNDDDGNASCRMTWVMEGGNYGYYSLDGRRNWRADQRLGQTTQVAHWHQEDPGTVPPTEVTGAGSPTGLAIYEGKLLPERFRGAVLNADAGRSSVWAHRVEPSGAGYRVTERVDFLVSRGKGDEARRYRPSDVAVGPDGAVYVADWYDPIVGGHGMRDKEGYGRIFRVAPRGANPRPPRADASTPEGAIDLLLGPAVNVRALGWQALAAGGPGAVAAVRKRLAAERDPRARARLLYFLATTERGRPDVVRALRDPDPDLRIAALRALRANLPSVARHLAALARDPSPAVRREVAVALRDRPVAESGPLLLALAGSYRGGDRAMLEAIGIGFDRKADALWPRLLARLGHRDPLKWSPAFADLAWRLHPEAAVPALRARVESPALPLPERQRALVALAFVPSRAAADAVVALAEGAGEPLKGYALDLAFDRAGNEWRGMEVAERLRALQVGPGQGEEGARFERLKAAVLRDGPLGDRAKAVETLAGSPEGGNFLIGLAAQNRLAPELKEAAAQVIFRNPDVGVRALASQYFKRPAFDGVEFPPVPELLKMKGDAGRGRQVYFGDRAACARCHEYGGQGGNIGPALTDIAGKLGREALLDSILNPSAAIAFGYEVWVISTRDEQTYTGFVIGDGETVLLREISGETRLIPARDIVRRNREKTSIMPDNIALGMSPQELVDLVEFLASGKK